MHRNGTMSKTQGAVLLAKLGKTQQDIAEAIGVSRPLVAFWLHDQRSPTVEMRGRMMKRFQIPADAWDQEAKVKAKPIATPAPAAASTVAPSPELDPGDVVGGCKAQIARLTVERLASDDPKLRARFEELELNARHKLSMYLGEGRVITEAVLLRSPAFQKVVVKILGALHNHPAALLDVTEALEVAVEAS